jgi:hypothetical protein
MQNKRYARDASSWIGVCIFEYYFTNNNIHFNVSFDWLEHIVNFEDKETKYVVNTAKTPHDKLRHPN